MRTSGALAALTTTVLLAGAAPSFAAQRYASPTGSTTPGCLPAAPCGLNAAVQGARANDEVIVAPGTYNLTAGVKATVPVAIHGVDGQPRPAIVAPASLNADTLELNAGGSVRHLDIEGASSSYEALDLTGGVGSDLILVTTIGDAAELHGAAAGTLLRDSVARATGTNGWAVDVRSGGAGGVKLLNVTAYASGSSSKGINNAMTSGTLTVANVIAHGASQDIEGRTDGTTLVTHSNFRPGASVDVTDGGMNQGTTPLFVSPESGDLHERGDSPTIDAGSSDPQSGTTDPDGTPRAAGVAPDIGAYEMLVGPPAPAPASASSSGAAPGPSPRPDAVRPPALPQAGRTVVVQALSGTVRVRRPGSRRLVSFDGTAPVPTGSVLDTTHGAVRLTSAKDLKGATQAGVFSGAVFSVGQKRSATPRTALVLQAGDFSRCRARPRAAHRSVTAAGGTGRVVRRLWGRDRHGRFTTRGRYGAASVRGTEWLTEDRCDGTYVYVRHGAVSVHDDARHRDVLVRAGRHYLARRAARR